MEKLEISRNGFNSWTLWKITAILGGECGTLHQEGIFSGTRKECLEEKNRLEEIKNEKRTRRNFKKN